MTKKLLLLFLCSIIINCTAWNNPLRQKNVISSDSCKTDITQPINLERLNFVLPVIWSKIKPCAESKISYDLKRDTWHIAATATLYKNNAYFQTSVLEFNALGNLHLLGDKQIKPDEWLSLQKNRWEKSRRLDFVENRNINRVKKDGLDCWHVVKTSYIQNHNRKTTRLSPSLISNRSISYTCWQNKDSIYPPLTISAGISYKNGKPVYSVDLEKDLLQPVFNRLTINKLSPENLKRRIYDRNEKFNSNCVRLKKMVLNNKKNGLYRDINEFHINSLNECGMNILELRKWWCNANIADEGYKTKELYMNHPKIQTGSHKENIEACK